MSSDIKLMNLKNNPVTSGATVKNISPGLSSNSSTGFKETLILNNTQKTSVPLKVDRTICPKIYSLHDKLETKYQLPSQLPYVTGLIIPENVDNSKSDKDINIDKGVKSNKNTKKTFKEVKKGGKKGKERRGINKKGTKKLKFIF